MPDTCSENSSVKNAPRRPAASADVLVHVRSTTGWSSLKLKELWRYRELLWFFLIRDLKVRYKQTILGASWAILQPFLTMIIFSIFFGRFAQMPSDGVPYPIFAYCALVPWTFFSNGLTAATNSVVSNAGMVKKTYFPRLTLPLATILAGVVDFVLAFTILVGMMQFYKVSITAHVLWAPLMFALALVSCLGAGLWFSALNVRFRDVRYVVTFLTQVWLFMTPIAYPSSIVPEKWRLLYSLNPMVGVVEGFRWALLGTNTAPGPSIAISAFVAVCALVGGLFYFRRMERVFADII